MYINERFGNDEEIGDDNMLWFLVVCLNILISGVKSGIEIKLFGLNTCVTLCIYNNFHFSSTIKCETIQKDGYIKSI
jgi:hypothetical protein